MSGYAHYAQNFENHLDDGDIFFLTTSIPSDAIWRLTIVITHGRFCTPTNWSTRNELCGYQLRHSAGLRHPFKLQSKAPALKLTQLYKVSRPRHGNPRSKNNFFHRVRCRTTQHDVKLQCWWKDLADFLLTRPHTYSVLLLTVLHPELRYHSEVQPPNFGIKLN